MSRISLGQFEIHWEIAALDLYQVAAFFLRSQNAFGCQNALLSEIRSQITFLVLISLQKKKYYFTKNIKTCRK